MIMTMAGLPVILSYENPAVWVYVSHQVEVCLKQQLAIFGHLCQIIFSQIPPPKFAKYLLAYTCVVLHGEPLKSGIKQG